MCGITAVFGNCLKSEDFIKKSLNKIKHRGSSNFEYEIFENAGLGTNRLAIVGEDTGKQPISDDNNEIYAILNGEIYNYVELKNDLIEKGYKFKTSSDTEVLVYLYKEYGSQFTQMIDSEIFAFVIYDKKKNKFLAGRDRFGVKPLYYAIDKDMNYYFASELKQLSQFKFIEKIYEFPKGHIMYNNKLRSYYSLNFSDDIIDEKIAVNNISRLLEIAVKKRVNTNLPVAVLLSGGVDSSLIMEIANKYHNNVRAYILGYKESEDYKAAVKLCKERNYKFKVVEPNSNYDEKVYEMIESVETYEAQIIRHCFSLDIVAKQIKEDGYKIVLSGDNADEIFAGYNEFSSVSELFVNTVCKSLVDNMDRGHNKRLDRISMKHTLEIRSPFYDEKLVEFAMRINSKLKIKKNGKKIITKYILRKTALNYLPEYISFRYKAPFSNGAGMNVGNNYKNQDGDVAKKVIEKYKYLKFSNTNQEYKFLTNEERIYFEIFNSFNYTKLENNHERIITKEDLDSIESKCLKKYCENIKEYFHKKNISRNLISNIDNFQTVISNSLNSNMELKLIGFWGASNKKNINQNDINVINRFIEISDDIHECFNLKIKYVFLLSDIHASLNGYLKKNYMVYLKEIEKLLERKGFEVVYLSNLWKKYSLNYDVIFNQIKKNQDMNNFDSFSIIINSAKNLGFKNYEYEAKRYLIVRLIEKEILEKEYKNCIFHTFIKKELSFLYPENLALLHLWSEKRGVSCPPWFEF